MMVAQEQNTDLTAIDHILADIPADAPLLPY